MDPDAAYRDTDTSHDVGPVNAVACPVADTHAAASRAALRVVLADDHRMFREGLAALLLAQPAIHLVAQAADGEAAWMSILAHRPDVAILGLHLNFTPGLEVAGRVAAAPLGTRCLMLASHDDPAIACQALNAGASGYVLKADSFEQLLRALHSIDVGGSFVSMGLAEKVRELRRAGRSVRALSPREQDVVRLIAAGRRSKEIAQILGISPQTVDTHRRRLMKKLDLRSAAEVVRYAARSGLLA
jgi:DNA-binding NarL/FixJ family response regulator